MYIYFSYTYISTYTFCIFIHPYVLFVYLHTYIFFIFLYIWLTPTFEVCKWAERVLSRGPRGRRCRKRSSPCPAPESPRWRWTLSRGPASWSVSGWYCEGTDTVRLWWLHSTQDILRTGRALFPQPLQADRHPGLNREWCSPVNWVNMAW